MDTKKLKKQLNNWLDTITYFDDAIQEYVERYNGNGFMYKKFQRMFNEMYDLIKELNKEEENATARNS